MSNDLSGEGALGASLLVDESYRDKQIQAGAIKIVFQQSKSALLINLVNSVFLVYMLWGIIALPILFTWWFLLFTITIARITLTFSYLKTSPSCETAEKWGQFFTFGTLLSGCIWGSAGIFLYVPGQIEYQALLLLLLGGMGAGAYASYITHLPAFYAFFIPTLLPIIIHLASEADRMHYIMDVWGTALFIAFLMFSKNGNKAQMETLRLRYENQDLIDELRKKHQMAEQANKSKSRFLASASHDLRQPLFALGIFSQTLEQIATSHEIRGISKQIKRTFFALKGLLDSLLDISKLDAGVVKAEKSDFYLQELFARIRSEYEPMAWRKGITLRVVRTSAIVNSDSTILGRVLGNLVSNAIHYTNEGKVLVGVKRVEGNYEIRIYDTGIGIAEKNLDKIFNEFYQIGNKERDREKGLGLGLAIVKRSMDILGQPLSVTSVLGKGSVFCVSVTKGSTVSEQKEYTNNLTVLDEPVILVIEDEALIRTGMQQLLESWGYIALSAESGDDAINVVDTEGLHPDFIIADYRLRDGENGVDAAESVLQHINCQLPILIVTGDTAPERIREATKRGHEILHKPVSPDDLRKVLHRKVKGKVISEVG